MKILVLVISFVFLTVIAVLEIWKHLVPDRSKLVKKIEIALVIMAFIGGAVGLIREAVSPSDEEIIIETVDTVLKKGTVPFEKLQVAYEEIGRLKEQLAKAVERGMGLEKSGDVPEAKGLIEELRKSGDVSRLLEVLEKERDTHRDELIERNSEIAAVAYLKGDIEKSTEAVEEILKLKPDDLVGLTQKGHIHKLRGELGEAEDCYKRVLELSVQEKNEQAQAAALGNLGLIYRTRGELDKAEEMHKKALDIDEKLGLKEGMASDYGNLGLIYGTRGELEKAEEMFTKILDIHKELGHQVGMAIDYGNLGNVYYLRGELDKAEETFREGLKIDEKLGRLEGIAAKYSNLGLVYEKRGDIKKAREYWEKAVGLYKRIGMPHEVEKMKRWIGKLKG